MQLGSYQAYYKTIVQSIQKIVLKETVLSFSKIIINYMKIGSLQRFWQVFKEEDLVGKRRKCDLAEFLQVRGRAAPQ